VSFLEDVWYGRNRRASAVRGALWPLSRVYGFAMSTRRHLYDSGVFRSEDPVLPAVSVGNLSSGGTGKTPFAAWLAAQLGQSARPAIALRGYGGDEAELHRRLNPDVPVVVNVDRAAAIREAQTLGADVVVLDDAFQHRRIARVADVVLLSTEQLMRPLRLLPAGPWREPLSAARRADLIVVTRKSASSADAQRATSRLRQLMPGLAVGSVHLTPHQLVSVTDGDVLPLRELRGSPVTAIAAIGEPGVFRHQLEQLGARVSLAAFRDHHHFTMEEINAFANRVPDDGFAVCTLKDAVKLVGRWPGPSRLWYVSQQLVVEEGADDLEQLLKRMFDARATTATTAG
jgi:tetraacyldisaccharide 4'-kinase